MIRKSVSALALPSVVAIVLSSVVLAGEATQPSADDGSSQSATQNAEEDAADIDANTPVASQETEPDEWQPPPKRMGPPKGGKRMSPTDDVWIHAKRGVVLVDGRVSLRQGMLEMFACPRGTKEHESVVAVGSKAFLIHAALLNIGAEPGHPVRFSPDYQPAAGTEIEIQVLWVDSNGKKRTARGQDWVLDVRTKKAMRHPWVFAGSGFWKDETTGKRHYQAEAGDLICVSNFSSAMLDLPVESSQSNDGLAFEAFTDHIPPLGTHVRLVLTPKQAKPK